MHGMKHRTKLIFFQEWLFYETHILYLKLIFAILIWYLYHLYHLSSDLYHIDLISASSVSFTNFLYMCLAHLRSILSLCPFGLFFYAAATPFQLRRLYRVCKLSGRTSLHSLLSFFLVIFWGLNFHIYFKIPCLILGGKKNSLVCY